MFSCDGCLFLPIRDVFEMQESCSLDPQEGKGRILQIRALSVPESCARANRYQSCCNLLVRCPTALQKSWLLEISTEFPPCFVQVYHISSDSYETQNQHYGRSLTKETVKDGKEFVCHSLMLWVIICLFIELYEKAVCVFPVQ